MTDARAEGLSIEQLVAEYRALRSSVLRLWVDAYPPGPEVIQDNSRFNEAINQAVAESVQFYAQESASAGAIFSWACWAMICAVRSTRSRSLSRRGAGTWATRRAHRDAAQGVKRLTSLLDSLLEYSRSSYGIGGIGIGIGMTLQRQHVDLAEACAEELVLLRAASPHATIEFSALGETEGDFDVSRVREALGNLVFNAVKHGKPSRPTVVTLEGEDRFVRISVENVGDIPDEGIAMLFELLYQRASGRLRPMVAARWVPCQHEPPALCMTTISHQRCATKLTRTWQSTLGSRHGL